MSVEIARNNTANYRNKNKLSSGEVLKYILNSNQILKCQIFAVYKKIACENNNKVHDQKLKEGEIFFSRVALHLEATMVKTLAQHRPTLSPALVEPWLSHPRFSLPHPSTLWLSHYSFDFPPPSTLLIPIAPFPFTPWTISQVSVPASPSTQRNAKPSL